MRTEAQIKASRANGAKSRGPATTIGRAISAQNSTARGLAGAKRLVIQGELHTVGEPTSRPATAMWIETELITEIAAVRAGRNNQKFPNEPKKSAK